MTSEKKKKKKSIAKYIRKMLKIIPPTTHCGCGYFKSKCAEIHYQTRSFSILCIFCGMTTHSYVDFLEHFRSQHFEDFSTTEPVVTHIYKGDEVNETAKRRSHHDPLDFGEREISADPEDLMKKLMQAEQLKSEKEVEALAAASATDSDTQAKSNNGKDLLRAEKTAESPLNLEDDAEFNESDEEYLICKIKVEQNDLHAINPTKPRRAQKQLTRIKHENSFYLRDGFVVKDDNNTETTTTTPMPLPATSERLQMALENGEGNDDRDAIAGHNDSDDGANEDGDVESEHVVGDIDWTQPYEPNLLRQHEKRPYKPRNKPNNCSYCGRTFRRRYQLDTHLNIHTGRKPHQCDICGRQFRAVTTLTRHLNTHAQRDAYQCRFCAKSFTHKAALLSHELRHTQERRVPCDECTKFFYTLNQMDTHKRKVHHKSDGANGAADDAALPFACDLCPKRYRSASMLSTHKFKKHYKSAKFACEQCGKKFIDPQQLEAHKRIHIVSTASLKLSSECLVGGVPSS